MTHTGFPHSDISGSMSVCFSPELIAAYHVLHRLLVPRHPPYALSSLIKTLSFDVPKHSFWLYLSVLRVIVATYDGYNGVVSIPISQIVKKLDVDTGHQRGA